MGKDFEYTAPSLPFALKVKYPFKILPRGYVVNVPQYEEFMKVINGKKNKLKTVTLYLDDEYFGKIGNMNLVFKERPTPGEQEYNLDDIFI